MTVYNRVIFFLGDFVVSTPVVPECNSSTNYTAQPFSGGAEKFAMPALGLPLNFIVAKNTDYTHFCTFEYTCNGISEDVRLLVILYSPPPPP